MIQQIQYINFYKQVAEAGASFEGEQQACAMTFLGMQKI